MEQIRLSRMFYSIKSNFKLKMEKKQIKCSTTNNQNRSLISSYNHLVSLLKIQLSAFLLSLIAFIPLATFSKMTYQQKRDNILIKLLIVSLLLGCCVCDCPIQYYPQDTIVGSIDAQINNDKAKQNIALTYLFTLKDSLSSATPSVLIGLNDIQYNYRTFLNFTIQNIPNPQFGTLNFQVYVQDEKFNWRNIKFNFIATNNINFAVGLLKFNSFSLPTAGTITLAGIVPVNDNMKLKPIVQTYLAGVSLNNTSDQAALAQAQNQATSYAKFSWTLNIIKSINQMIETQSAAYLQITSSKLFDNSTLTVKLQINDFISLSSIWISYIVISTDFTAQNNLIYKNFQLNSTQSAFSFQPLDQTDMTFIGLKGFKGKINTLLNFNILTQASNSYSIYVPLTLNNQSIYFGSIQINTKFDYQCSSCDNSPFRFQSFCLQSCPRSYVNIFNGTNSSCQFCNITNYFIPNSDSSQCVCAQQHFINRTGGCSSCDYSCLTCTSQKKCSTCDNSQFATKRVLDISSGLCTCPIGYFDDSQNQNLICQPCYKDCLTCFGSSMYNCITCVDGRSLDNSGKCSCSGNFQDINGTCSCLPPNVLMNKNCFSLVVSNCGPNMISITSKNNQTSCQCQNDFTLFNNSCISCPSGYTLNKKTGICQCVNGSYIDNFGNCLSCPLMKQYNQNLQKCLCMKQYYQDSNGVCVDCPDKSVFNNDACQCIYNYYLLNNVCVKCKSSKDDPKCNRVQF